MSHDRNKVLYERKLNERSYRPGDNVFLYRNVPKRGEYHKFVRPWRSAVIVEQCGPLNYRVREEGKRRSIVVHHNRLKPDNTRIWFRAERLIGLLRENRCYLSGRACRECLFLLCLVCPMRPC